MKVVILAGGFGTRISEESHLRPKPMIEIGEKPILWHIMKIYSYYGFNEFIICLGYKSHMIKEFFADYYLHTSDVTFDLSKNEMEVHNNYSEPWKVTLVDTGLNSLKTSFSLFKSRISPIMEFIFDSKSSKLNSVLDIDNNQKISNFAEKTKEDGGWINGGFMVLEPEVLEYINGDETIFERDPLENLAKDDQLMAYKHHGYWQCMDTKRDHDLLQELWDNDEAPWYIWK